MYNKTLKISEKEYNNILNGFIKEKDVILNYYNKLQESDFAGNIYDRVGFEALRYTQGNDYIVKVLYDQEGLNDNHISTVVKRVLKYLLQNHAA